MATHDIIDNRSEKLVDHLNQILGSSERARFAVGYLFLSGLTSVAKRLLPLKERDRSEDIGVLNIFRAQGLLQHAIDAGGPQYQFPQGRVERMLQVCCVIEAVSIPFRAHQPHCHQFPQVLLDGSQ